MSNYILSKSIWINNIIPYLMADAITNPIYNLRLTCKYFNSIFTIEPCKQILHWLGLSKIFFDKSIELTNAIFIKEISLIMEVKRDVGKYDVYWAAIHNKINVLQWLLESGLDDNIKQWRTWRKPNQ